jgi:hypothetical protein
MREAVKPASQTAQLYRVLEADLDGDILRAAPAFVPSPHVGRYDSSYAFRMFWPVLSRRCAIGHAWRLAGSIKNPESFPWRVWRAKEYLMVRLFVGVLLGYLILLASSGLIDVFQRLQYKPQWYVVPVLFFALVLGLAHANVQRQVGRISTFVLFKRSLALVGYGVVYASIGAGVHDYGAAWLSYEVTYPFVCLCASSAMLLGFVFQLFLQDKTLGDPL